MAALDQHRARPRLAERARHRANRRRGRAVDATERLRLGKIGRDDSREREQAAEQRALAGRVEQPRAGARNKHRVDHRRGQIEPGDRVRDHLDDFRRAERAGLERVGAALGDSVSICARDHRGLDRRHAIDGRAVLRDHRGDRRVAVNAERGEGFEVGLDSRAAARIAAGDRKHDAFFSALLHAATSWQRISRAAQSQDNDALAAGLLAPAAMRMVLK